MTTDNKDTLLFFNKTHHYFLIMASLIAGVSFFDFLASWYLIELIGIALSKDNSGIIAEWQAVIIFIIGYLARPLGAYFIGKYGDKQGRKKALSLNFLLFILFTLIIALLPSYQFLDKFGLGFLAIFLLIIAKFGQGFAFASQFPILWTYATENLPLSNIGLGCGIITASAMIGGLSFLVFMTLIENTLTQNALIEYGWRLPFFISAGLGILLWLMVKKLNETPIFLKNQTSSNAHHQLSFFDKKRWKKSLSIAGLSWVISSIVMTMVFLLEILLQLSFANYDALLSIGVKVTIFFLIIGSVFFGLLTDLTNAAKVLVIGSLLFLISLFGLFYDLETGGRLLVLSFSLSGFFAGVIGAIPALMVRLIPSQYRLSNIALIYNMVFASVGIILPIILGYATFYAKYSPVVYMSFMFVITLFFSFYLYYFPKDQDELERFN